jgi:tRNA-splicing ligase RtcB
MCKAEIAEGRIKIWTDLDGVEPQALNQLKNIAQLPWVFKHVAVMPDVHFGIGATVGSVIAMKDAVSPAAVGVDIGCGMAALKTNLKVSQLPDNLNPLRSSIERSVPVGFNSHQSSSIDRAGRRALANNAMNGFEQLRAPIKLDANKTYNQVGTPGGGNHFIEICQDEDQNVWVMLHSGSRNVGKTLAEYHIAAARKLAHNDELPDRDLAVFLAGTQEMTDYWHDLDWAQQYAYKNRSVMMELVKFDLQHHFPHIEFGEYITCHHNYLSKETYFGEELLVTRKGAIYAGKGKMGIIPGSMGTKSYIVEGLGNQLSWNSASHGAGRRMSRGEAKRRFTLADMEAQTAGVECRKDKEVLDEIPGAYKNIDEVIENQRDLVRVRHTLKQLLCVKG